MRRSLKSGVLICLILSGAWMFLNVFEAIPETRAQSGSTPDTTKTGFENLDTGPQTGKQRNSNPLKRSPAFGSLLNGITRNLGPMVSSNRILPNQLGVGRRLDLEAEEAFVKGDASDLMVLKSPGAKGIRVHLEGLNLSDGEMVYVRSFEEAVSGKETVQFTKLGPNGDGQFWSDVVFGDTVVIERVRTKKVDSNWKSDSFKVTELSHLFESPVQNLNSVGACEVDARCGPQRNERNSVTRLVYINNGDTFACTGTILATVNQDRSPYVLTANHCIGTSAAAQTVQAFWFYQSIACNSNTLQSGIFASATGAAILQTNQAADQTLLEILGVVPRTLTYSGWDTSSQPTSTTVFSLHHPGSGFPNAENELDSYLRQANGNITAVGQTCSSTGATNAYQVTWNQGIVESGSGGAGLWFTNNGQNLLTGVLTACGNSACGQPANMQTDTFARFSDFAPQVATELAGGSDDSFEPNDSRATASVVTGVNASGLVVKQNNEDWYSITVGPGQTLSAVASFVHSYGDIDLELYRNAENNPVAVSDSSTNSETISFQNVSGTNTYFLRVLLFNDVRNTYSLNFNSGGCSYAIDPTASTASAGGGTGTVQVTAGSGCPWTAASNVSWITINSGATGTGNGTVGYSVSANPGPQRSGTATIAGQTFTVTQANGCSYSINPTSMNFLAAGGTGTVAVTASDSACLWTSTSNVSWITITSGATGTGNGTVGYSVSANPGPQRSGTATIAGQTFTVTQTNGCAYSINPTSMNFIAVGSTGTVAVTASDSACTWTSTSNVSWITITSGATGTGNGTVGYSVATNPGPQRSGTATIAGQTFTINQDNGCVYVVDPLSFDVTWKGGTRKSSVTTTAGCPIEINSNAAWLTGQLDAGNIVSIQVARNSGVPRIGTISVGGQAITINQTARGASTPGQYRPSNGFVYIRNSNDTGFADREFFYGTANDIPVAGDWNGDGIDTVGIYRNGKFFLRNSNTTGFADLEFPFGIAGDIPLVGDWDGDGIDTIGVVRGNTVFLRNSNTAGDADIQFNYGTSTDIFIAGDWDGDGIDTIGAFRPTNGFVYLRNSNTTGFADLEFFYGIANDRPIAGDWNGDGVDTIGIVRGNGWYLRNSNTSGFADILFFYGVETDVPITGNWDGQ